MCVYIYIKLRMQLIHITHLHIQRNDRVIGVTDFAKITISYIKMLLIISPFCLKLKLYSKNPVVPTLLEKLESGEEKD